MSSLIPAGSYHMSHYNFFSSFVFACDLWNPTPRIYSKGKRASKNMLILICRVMDALEKGSKKGKC